MPLKNYIKGPGGIKLDELIMLSSVKLFLPLSESIADKSVGAINTITNSNVNLVESGAQFNGTNSRLNIVSNIPDHSGDFTFEVITNVLVNQDYPYLFGKATNRCFCLSFLKSTGQLRILSYNNETIFFDYNPYYGKDTHIAIVCKGNSLKLYINGNLMKEEVKQPALTLSLNGAFVGGDSALANIWFKGMIGGLKITYLPLEPSQFSLLRPMKLKYPNFKVGNIEYIYKDGVWNPNFERTIVGSVLFNPNAIVVNASLSIYSTLSIILDIAPTKKVFMDYKITTVSASPNTDYLTLINSGGDYTIFDLGLWETNKSRRIVGMLMGKYNKMFSISSYAKQQVLVYGIWIE